MTPDAPEIPTISRGGTVWLVGKFKFRSFAGIIFKHLAANRSNQDI